MRLTSGDQFFFSYIAGLAVLVVPIAGLVFWSPEPLEAAMIAALFLFVVVCPSLLASMFLARRFIREFPEAIGVIFAAGITALFNVVIGLTLIVAVTFSWLIGWSEWVGLVLPGLVSGGLLRHLSFRAAN